MKGLDARVLVRRPAHVLDVHLTARPGEVVAVVGPNGSGKTTLLRALAGLVRLTDGRVTLDGTGWEGGGTRLPVQDRHVGVVFQELLLFPHLTARDNVGYGLRARGADRRTSRTAADAWLHRLGVGDLGNRRPGQLSGGQAQRVAIARALAPRPRLLLLDEPLAALDVGVAMTLRLELARHLSAYDGVTLLVTHDAVDALTMADRVVVLDDGRVIQDGTPEEVARRPRTPHVARLVGLNVLHGRSRDTRIELPGGELLLTSTPYDGAVHATFPPAAVTVGVDAPTGSARNQWQGQVVSVAPHGLAVRVHLDITGGLIADVTAESAARLGLVPGRSVWATVKATEVEVHGAGASEAAPLP
ncbi:MAG TPA: ABC transporter ATP-binding protein [Marmoricola sp.]|nr:ABC transporter ATP-binding protein [Marmoricola sp.]